MAKISLTNGRDFIANPGICLLDAAYSADVALPYSCRTGRCGSCKALVKRGQTSPLTDETGLSSKEIKAGWILTCVRIAETDTVLDIEDLRGIHLPQAKTFPCRIAEIERMAPDILRVRLRLPPSSTFSFIPGQYIDIIGTNGIRRSYSLANANFSDKLLELHIREVIGGAMSDYWFNHAKLNDLLRLNGPLGTFFLRESTNSDLFFLATGTGIAPIKAILESLAYLPEDQNPKSITVLWGGRKPDDFYIDITAIPGKHKYIPVVSRPEEKWPSATGYIQDVMLSMAPKLDNAVIYACGSNKMIQSAKQVLSNIGLPLDRFYSDAFVSSSNN